MPRSFAVRGVVEGFYGTPWSHDARLEVVSYLARHGMNAYVYAPKDDPYHRAEWRTPYPAPELEQFRELAAYATRNDVRLGFALSPGLDIHYDDDRDRAALLAKLGPLRDAGVRWFLLLLDDIPMEPELAPRQAALGTWLLGALRDAGAGAELALCPTEYVGTHPSPYLSELGNGLPPEVDIMWTGPTVCSPTLRAEDARDWAAALGGRRVIVWDNYPVNDALMTRSLHLGPYNGRDAALADVVGGVLCNPMTQARASQIPLATAMDFLSDPERYDAGASWTKAIDEIGGERCDALAVLARACADSPVAQPSELRLAREVDALVDEMDGPGWQLAVRGLAGEMRAARALPLTFTADGDPLSREVAAWAFGARIEAEAGLAALRLLQASRPLAAVDGERGRAVAPGPESAMHAAFLLLYVWSAARADEKVVYGPRFAVYTPVVQLPNGAPALDAAAAVREDCNAIDALCRLALRTYDEWRTGASTKPLRVLVDGEERALGDDGSFDARGSMILVRQGALATRVAPGDAPPFRDHRLA